MNGYSGNSRRRFLCALAAAAAAVPFGAAAQGISKRPVRIIVPFTPAAGPDIVARLLAKYNVDIRAIVAQPDMREQLAAQGLVPSTGTSEAFAKLVKSDYDKWGRVMREANIKAD